MSEAERVEPSPWGVRVSLLTIVMFFGGSVPAYRFTGQSFGPATANLFRFLIAVVVLLIASRRYLAMPRVERRRLFLIGMFGIGLMAFFLGAGVDESTGIIGSIVIGLEPIGVALAGMLMVGDRPTATSLAALVIGFVGTMVASGVFNGQASAGDLVAILLLLGTVVTFSVYTAHVRRTPREIHPLAVASMTQLGALVFVVPACIFDVVRDGMFRNGAPTRSAVLGVLFLGVGSAIAYLLLCLVLSRVQSSRVAVSMFLTPMFGVLFSWWIVGESLHPRHAVGAALVLLALWIMEYLPGVLQRRNQSTSQGALV